jgi:dihydroorotase
LSASRFDLVVRGGHCVLPWGVVQTDIGVRDGRIEAFGDLAPGATLTELDGRHLHVLPGVIDSQVHFREPGLEHKEDLQTGTAAAALGGVTTVLEMPNTSPATTTASALAEKAARARGRAWVDIGFFVGATAENVAELGALERLAGCAGVKVFMGSSTGSLLVSDEAALLRVFEAGRRRVAIHAEDDARLKERSALATPGAPATHPVWRDELSALIATARCLRAARATRRRVHVLHVTTAEEMALLAGHRDLASVEVTPQHLTLVAPDSYERLGTRAQMNPPIRDARHRAALWQAIRDGLVDVLASDHAPHTLHEKASQYPRTPSGMPGVQTLLPVMLTHVHRERLSLQRLVELVAAGPARVYGISNKGRLARGMDADFTLVDLTRRVRLSDDMMASKCGWTPFAGDEVTGWPVATVLRGKVVMREGDLFNAPSGNLVTFEEGDAAPQRATPCTPDACTQRDC